MDDGIPADARRAALEAVRAALDADGGPGAGPARAAAVELLRTSPHKRLVALAHLLQPGATPRAIQAAIVPLERAERRLRVTDAEMGIRTTDAAPGDAPRLTAGVTVVADNIRSAFNAGGIFRTADFFGFERIVLCGFTPGPENAQVVKTALGAEESVPSERSSDVRTAIDSLRARGLAIYALETADRATDVTSDAFAPRFPCALLLGNERFGLDPDVVASADEVLQIPSHGLKNSINVVSAFAVAAALLRMRFDAARRTDSGREREV